MRWPANECKTGGRRYARRSGIGTTNARPLALAFAEGTAPAYDLAMDSVTLPPVLERFATEAIAAGRYRD
jgi:hypothetical protein